MNKKVSEFVRKYVEEHLDKSDPKQQFEVFVVWQCYILGNAKWYPKHDGRNEDTGDAYYQGHSIELSKGSIKKLIGRELTWDDEPVELK